MTFRHIPLKQITAEALHVAVANGTRESASLDFKRELPGPGGDERSEFLKDISAMANAEGGDLVYGVEDDGDGVVSKVPGLDTPDRDERVRALRQQCQSSLDPVVVGLEWHEVDLDGGRWCLIIRVPRSLDAPHMVTHRGSNRFYVRVERESRPMVVAELRNSVLRGAAWPEIVDRWRRTRVDVIRSGDSPVLLNGRGRLAVHLAPMATMGPIDFFTDPVRYQMRRKFPPVGTGDSRPTFEGMLTPGGRPPAFQSYVLWFRDGRVEIVVGDLVRTSQQEQPRVGSLKLANLLDKSLALAFDGMKVVGTLPPILVMVSMTDVKGCTFNPNSQSDPFPDHFEFDRADYLLDGELIREFADGHEPLLARLMDAIHWAAGVERWFERASFRSSP